VGSNTVTPSVSYVYVHTLLQVHITAICSPVHVNKEHMDAIVILSAKSAELFILAKHL